MCCCPANQTLDYKIWEEDASADIVWAAINKKIAYELANRSDDVVKLGQVIDILGILIELPQLITDEIYIFLNHQLVKLLKNTSLRIK